jgi:hypothetical protein
VILTGPSLTTHGHNGHDGYNGHDGDEDHDGHNSHDDVIAIDAHIQPVGTLTTMAVDDTTPTNLLNRWIVDPGSNTHVVNTEAWRGWKRTSDNLERRSINAGNSCILIIA